ncbi:MAG: amidohydrolase family protein [Bacteroidota bacterium]
MKGIKQFANLLFILASILIYNACDEAPVKETPEPGDLIALQQGTNISVSLSPDKKTLAMDLQGRIWVLPVNGGIAKPITSELGGSHLPIWSPDGSRIAFHSYLDGNFHVYSIKADGTDLQQHSEGSYDYREPFWSKDGKRIICSSDREGNYDLWETDLTTKNWKQITSSPGDEYYPAYSPDNQTIVFVDRVNGLSLKDAEGRITRLPSLSGQIGMPLWSPSGQELIVHTIQDGNTHQLRIGISQGNIDTLKTSNKDIFPFRGSWLSDSELVYTADGKICRRMLGQESYISIDFTAYVDFRRKAYTRKTYDFDNQNAQIPMGIRSPELSPDGKSILFSALGDIWIQEIGGNARKITDDPAVDLDPTWSPDGRQIAFVSDRKGTMDLWVYNLETEKDRRLSRGEDGIIYPAWSPDGEKIAYYNVSRMNFIGPTDLKVLTLSNVRAKVLKEGLFGPGAPSWSPNSEHLVFSELKKYSARFREGRNQATLISIETKAEKALGLAGDRPLGTRGNNGPIWSPDGKHMAFIQEGQLWIQAVDTLGNTKGNAFRITEELADSPSWSGDSKSILYLATDRLKRIDITDGKENEIPLAFTWKRAIPEDTYVIRAGKLFDGKSTQYRNKVDILVEGNRIKEITPVKNHPEGVQIIDASNRTIIPGLIDTHTHQTCYGGELLGKIWLAYGITSVRETGGDPYDARERKESWSSEQRPGPRLFFTGNLTDGSRVYYEVGNAMLNPAQLMRELERARRLEYDLVKTYVRLPDSAQKMVVETAHSWGLPVSSHEIYPASAYGVDAVEHVRSTSRRGYSLKQSETSVAYQDVTEILSQSGMYLSPTLALTGGLVVHSDENPEILKQKTYQELFTWDMQKEFRDLLNIWKANGLTRWKKELPSEFAHLRKLLDAGGKITAGTDSPIIPYGWSLHTELQLYVKAGLSPFEALQTSTIRAAESLGVDRDLGSLEPGKLADFVIVNGDPLTNISDAWNVDRVVKNGRIYRLRDLTR